MKLWLCGKVLRLYDCTVHTVTTSCVAEVVEIEEIYIILGEKSQDQ